MISDGCLKMTNTVFLIGLIAMINWYLSLQFKVTLYWECFTNEKYALVQIPVSKSWYSVWINCSGRKDCGRTGWSSDSFCRGTMQLHTHDSVLRFGHLRPRLCRSLPPPLAPTTTTRPLPQKCLYWVCPTGCCGALLGRAGRLSPWGSPQRGHLSGPASVSGLLRPRRCAGERWQNEGRRCQSRRCPTLSCWLQPEANMIIHTTWESCKNKIFTK